MEKSPIVRRLRPSCPHGGCLADGQVCQQLRSSLGRENSVRESLKVAVDILITGGPVGDAFAGVGDRRVIAIAEGLTDRLQ